MGYNGMCGPKWSNGFSDVLVRNWVSILVILVINRIWFLHSSLDMSMFLGRSHFFVIIEKQEPMGSCRKENTAKALSGSTSGDTS